MLAADPIVESLNALPDVDRGPFLHDVGTVGDALLKVTRAWRINYAILGNGDPTLHAHIQPRYLYEDEPYRRGPVDRYGQARLESVPFEPERDRLLMQTISSELRRAGRP